jgi:hypothetical protein
VEAFLEPAPALFFDSNILDTVGSTSETNSTCKLTALRVEPHVIPAHKRMRIIPCCFLTELHDLRFFFCE